MIRVAIVEDEQACRDSLLAHLRRFAKENGVAFDIMEFRSALELVEEYRPVFDILFMDIEMPLLDGLSAAQHIYETDQRVMIVFVTHIAKYAVQSYDVQAADYILKPLRYPVFSMKLQKVLRRLKRKDRRYLLLQEQNTVRRLAADDICYIEVSDHKLTYHTTNGNISVKDTMRNAEKELAGESFVRCNQCYLVNLAYFQELRGEIAYVHGDELKVSRTRRKEFLEAILKYQRGDAL